MLALFFNGSPAWSLCLESHWSGSYLSSIIVDLSPYLWWILCVSLLIICSCYNKRITICCIFQSYDIQILIVKILMNTNCFIYQLLPIFITLIFIQKGHKIIPCALWSINCLLLFIVQYCEINFNQSSKKNTLYDPGINHWDVSKRSNVMTW